MNKVRISQLFQNDAYDYAILRVVSSLQLSDWFIGAGFVRNKVWDVLHGYKRRTLFNDIDIIYFDSENIDEKDEGLIEEKLRKLRPDLPWSVKNQARMALVRGDGPYKNAEDGLSRWIETATCVGARLNKGGSVEIAAPLGVGDLVHLILRKNTKAKVSEESFRERIAEKKWLSIWPKLRIID